MNIQNTNHQRLIANKKGFSLLELLVAIFIFSIIMVATTGIFGRSINGYRNAKAIQKDLENAQDAMNTMAKTLRTSTIHDCFDSFWGDCSAPPFQAIRIYDYSQSKCIMYNFRSSDNVLEAINFSIAGTADPAVECINGSNYGGSSAASDLIDTGNVTGQFNITQSTVGQVGKVTVSIEVAPDPSTPEKDKARMQTSVSLRDYDEAGL